jgi:RimJ/RimL family protein N-acetyltransferase
MTILATERLVLESITPALAGRIVAGAPIAGDAPWHPEYPWIDELDPLRMLARLDAPDPVFTMYQVRTRDDGLAVGGIGLFGRPDAEGRVELGYGLVPSARGRGLATEALRAVVRLAAEHGARTLAADTEPANAASQHVLLAAGFAEVRRDAELVLFERRAQPEDPSSTT